MIHAFRLGPIAPTAPPAYAYAAIIPGHPLEVRQAHGDAQGLAALREAVKGQPFTCEPALAEAAGTLGLPVAPLPAEVLAERAVLAWELGSGVDPGASRPDAIGAFLQAAAAYWASKAWELIPPDEQLHVTFAVGRALVQGELSVQATDPAQPRLVLCDEAGPLEALAGLAGEARVAALARGAGLVIELAREPAWAGAVIEEVHRLPRIPMPERRRGGRVAAVATADLALAAALLKGVQAYADLGDGSEAEVEVAAGGLRVKARVGPTPADLRGLSAWEDDLKLTPVADGAGSAPPRPEPAMAAPPPGGDDGTAALAAELGLNAEELAAIVKGGDAPEAEPPAPSAGPAAAAAPDEDDRPLSPEELAALMKGAAAEPPEAAPEPVFDPAPAVAPPPPAPEPAPRPEPRLTPVAPPPAKVPAAKAPAPAKTPAARQAAPAEGGGGIFRKVWRALGGGRPADPAPPARKPAAPSTAPARPAAGPSPRPSAPRAEPTRADGPDPDGPFGPFARALKIAVPPAPPALPLAEAERARELAQRLAADAARQERFVSFPAVALQIIELVHAPDADARGVAGFISRDPGLAADVLAVANSAAFRGVSEVTSVRDAVARLGLQEVGRVASAVSARALLVPSRSGGGQTSTRLFTRAVAVATAASAAALGVRGARSDQVWLAGLLHDVGLALGGSALHRLESAGGAGAAGAALDLALEEAHVEIGAAALKAWGLPRYIADVCARHHEPEVPAQADLVDLHLVRLASALSRLSEPAVAARSAREIVQSAGALRLDAPAVRALAADLKAAEQRAAVLVR